MIASEKSDRHEAVHEAHAARLVQYATGDPVPATGIYEISYYGQQREPEALVLISGHHFPSCGEDVQFRLLTTAPYIFEDEDFAP